MHQIHQNSVLVLNVGLFLLHLALQDQVAKIALLGEPDEEVFEGRLDGFFGLLASNEQTGHMTGAGDPLDFAQEVGLGCVVVTAVLFAELLHLGAVGRAEILPDDLFSDVAADVLAVVAGLLGLHLLLFGLEHLGTDALLLRDGVVGEDERAFSVSGGSNELAEDGIVGLLARQPVHGL
jgi:hypothetical protein